MRKEIYYKYFEENIKPLIYPLEKERKKAVKQVIISSFVMFLCGVACIYIYIFLALKDKSFLLLLPIVLFMMYFFFIKSITNVIIKGKEYQNSLITNILPLFLKPVANFKKWPRNHDIQSFLNSQLFPNFENREDDMSIFGIYKDVNITICGTKLTIPVNKILFQGTTIQLEFNKSINNHIILISKNQQKYNNYNQVNPQIKDLNQYLYTFSKNDNIESINENFWECIKKIGEVYTAREFGLSYNNKTMLIALSQKQTFKFGFIFKSLLEPNNYDELINMFVVIFDLIDVLIQ